MKMGDAGDGKNFIADLQQTPQRNQRIAKVITPIKKMLGAVSNLHSADIAHHDIKPDNFLFYQNGKVKITTLMQQFIKMKKSVHFQ